MGVSISCPTCGTLKRYYFHMMDNILIDLTVAFAVNITGVGGWHGGSRQPWITRLVFLI